MEKIKKRDFNIYMVVTGIVFALLGANIVLAFTTRNYTLETILWAIFFLLLALFDKYRRKIRELYFSLK